MITDFKLPSFNALRVLEILEERKVDLPALVVTGAIDDELAADCIKRGAMDYLLKDRLARLGDAMLGAIARHRARREKRQAEEKLLAEAKARVVLYSMLPGPSPERPLPGASGRRTCSRRFSSRKPSRTCSASATKGRAGPFSRGGSPGCEPRLSSSAAGWKVPPRSWGA